MRTCSKDRARGTRAAHICSMILAVTGVFAFLTLQACDVAHVDDPIDGESFAASEQALTSTTCDSTKQCCVSLVFEAANSVLKGDSCREALKESEKSLASSEQALTKCDPTLECCVTVYFESTNSVLKGDPCREALKQARKDLDNLGMVEATACRTCIGR